MNLRKEHGITVQAGSKLGYCNWDMGPLKLVYWDIIMGLLKLG